MTRDELMDVKSYPMECDKCGAGVQTTELSHRERKCSCIGCGGRLQYITADRYAALRTKNEGLRDALRHYANKSNWYGREQENMWDIYWQGSSADGYDIAQQALATAETREDYE